MAGFGVIEKLFKDRQSHCPNCGLLIKLSVEECGHCGNKIGETELVELKKAENETFKSSVLCGLVFFFLIFTFFVLVY